MKHVFAIIVISICFSMPVFAQIDSSFLKKLKSLDSANILKLDTMAVPNDRLTEKIKKLRKERKGLTIETVIRIKLAEAQAKDTVHSKLFYTSMEAELTTGKTGMLLENCLVNLYRRNYTETEIDDLINFYKTSAGKKMDKEYFILMIESAKDAEQLLKIAMEKAGNGNLP